MKLYSTPTSPYARKVRVVLAEKRIECETVMVPSLAAPDSPVPAYNPLGKVPTLVLGEDESLFDSVVIVDYLDRISPVSRLIPQDNHHRAVVRCLEALADGICDAVVAVVMEKRRVLEKQDDTVIERQILKVTRGLERLAEHLGDNKWCLADRFTLADIAVGCALAYIDLRMPELGWRELYPNLGLLYEHLHKRPSFQDTVPPAA